ncbi:MAG: AAA family ATPase [Deltaproteobacteria bacterium]|nr:AAA family ATPase [Deltaproteobacteria bacterium]
MPKIPPASEAPLYPFTALVGQEAMKLALVVNVVNPRVGGVLIRGEKGTAKSTAVRALAEILPQQEVVADCPFSCPPHQPAAWCATCAERAAEGEELPVLKRRVKVVELPVGATEDRLLGTLDLESALAEGRTRLQPGILAAANRQILYVDEVNLLDDHLVDALLDAAAMGVNTIERESLSVNHPASFTLVGTMNPEEGELRPQLTDRFGLCVQVKGLPDPAERAEVIRRRLEFEKNPAAFRRRHQAAGRQLGKLVARARRILPHVQAGPEILDRVVQVVLELGVDGHRGDLTLLKTSLTLAALEGVRQVEPRHVDQAALMALPHRLRRRPLAEMDFDIGERLGRI